MKLILLSVGLMLSVNANALSYDADVPAAIVNQMNQDLAFMAQITGSSQTPFHKEIYGEVSGPVYKEIGRAHV